MDPYDSQASIEDIFAYYEAEMIFEEAESLEKE